MCRYAFKGPYKNVYACFHCRKSYKQRLSVELTEAQNNSRKYLCPQCGQPMNSMGHDFRAPKMNDIKQWKKVEILYRRGFTYHSCGCGPGYRPKKLNEIDDFLESAHESNRGIRLLKKINGMNPAKVPRKYKLSRSFS